MFVCDDMHERVEYVYSRWMHVEVRGQLNIVFLFSWESHICIQWNIYPISLQFPLIPPTCLFPNFTIYFYILYNRYRLCICKIYLKYEYMYMCICTCTHTPITHQVHLVLPICAGYCTYQAPHPQQRMLLTPSETIGCKRGHLLSQVSPSWMVLGSNPGHCACIACVPWTAPPFLNAFILDL